MKVERQTKEVVVAHVVTLSAEELDAIKMIAKGNTLVNYPAARKLLIEMCGDEQIPDKKNNKEGKPTNVRENKDKYWNVIVKMHTPRAIECIVDKLADHRFVAETEAAKSHAVCDFSSELYENDGTVNLDKEIIIARTQDYKRAQNLCNDLQVATCVTVRIEEV